MKTLVTGANRGIGLALCEQLNAQGHEVLAACRQSSPELDQVGVEVVEQMDQCQPDIIASLASRVGKESLDILINCAGVMARQSLGSIDEAAITQMRQQFDTNAIGPLLVTQALLPALRHGSKVAIITSRMGSMGDNSSGGSYGYRMSKAAVNAAGVSLALDLAPAGVAVGIIHPGYVRTDMTSGNGLIDPPESAAGILDRIEALTLANSGTFWHINGEVLPW